MAADLVKALKRKDAKAFDQLIARHGAMIYRVAIRMLGGKEEAEEVQQEALLTVYEKIETFDERSALTTWLYRIVVNAALMRLRARSRAPEISMERPGPPLTEDGRHASEVADWRVSAEDALLQQEALTILRQAIERLPEPYRVAYVLGEIERLPHQEIAKLLELTTGTVKVRLHRARLFLREALAGYFEERQRKRSTNP